jgi:hypothetical protein
MDATTRPRPKHRGTWLVIIVGLIEIAAIAAFFEVKGVAGAVCSAPAVARLTGAGGGTLPGGGAQLPMGAGADAMPSADAGGVAQPVTAGSAVPLAAGSAAAAEDESAAGNASVKGDTNQIVDPNCVAKTAASLLNSDTPAPSGGATCGPMKQPEALKAAERQISH